MNNTTSENVNENKGEAYTLVNENYISGAIELLVLTTISIVPNLYFFVRCLTYKNTFLQKLHRKIILIMSSSYMLASLTSLIVVIFYLIHYVLETKVNIYTCNVLRRIATICTNFVYVMPLFISIERFFNILFQKSFNVILLTIVIITIEIPNISKQLSSIVSSNVTRTSDSICRVTIVVNNEFINTMNNVSYSITIVAPIIGCILNFIIYIISVKKLSKGHPNKTIIKQEKALFISVLIQSSFPLIFFGTSSTIPFINEKLKISKEIGWRIVDFIIYFGYATCILVSSFFVKALRNMVSNDFRILKKDSSVTRPFKRTC